MAKEKKKKDLLVENKHLKDKIAEALHYIHQGKPQNAIMVLNHAYDRH